MHFDREFQIVLRRFRVVFGGLWLLAPQSPSQHPKKVDQRTAAANSACIMRAVADGFTISTEHGVEQGNCAQASVGMGCVHSRTSYIERCSHAKFGFRNSSGPPPPITEGQRAMLYLRPPRGRSTTSAGPPGLYQVQYPAPGDPELALRDHGRSTAQGEPPCRV